PINDNIQVIQQLLQPLALRSATLTIERNNELIEKNIVLGEKQINGKSIGILGVEFDMTATPAQPFMSAVKQGIAMANLWVKNTVTGFTQLKKKHRDIAGPVMIIAMTTKAASAGWQILLLLLAIISINLAILNLIPLPIL